MPRRRRPRALAVVMTFVLVIAAGVGVGWWAGNRGGLGDFRRPPTVVSIVDFSMVAGSEQVQATSAPVLRSGDTSIMRMRAGDQELLSAVDVAGSSSYPLWTIPLPSGTDPCWVDSDIVHCGDGVAVDAGSSLL